MIGILAGSGLFALFAGYATLVCTGYGSARIVELPRVLFILAAGDKSTRRQLKTILRHRVLRQVEMNKDAHAPYLRDRTEGYPASYICTGCNTRWGCELDSYRAGCSVGWCADCHDEYLVKPAHVHKYAAPLVR